MYSIINSISIFIIIIILLLLSSSSSSSSSSLFFLVIWGSWWLSSFFLWRAVCLCLRWGYPFIRWRKSKLLRESLCLILPFDAVYFLRTRRFDFVEEMRNWKLPKQFFPVVLFIWTVLTNFLFSAAKEIQNCEYLRMKDIKQQFVFTIMFKIVAVLELQHESFKS